MGNSKASSIAPLAPAPAPGVPEAVEQPRDFHFAVTWVTLFAHLDLIPANGPWRRPATPSPTLALVPVAAAQVMIQPQDYRESDANLGAAAWEMVVPKMIRTGSGEFTPIERSEAGS
jgi:hypothetical protein